MRPDRVVMVSPAFDEHLRLLQCVEDLSIEQLVSEFPIEWLVVSVLPWASGFDEQRLNVETREPAPDR